MYSQIPTLFNMLIAMLAYALCKNLLLPMKTGVTTLQFKIIITGESFEKYESVLCRYVVRLFTLDKRHSVKI